MQESELYESVKKFIEKTYNCFYATKEAGKQGIGSVDVFGVHYENLEKTKIETVGVEVKKTKIPISANFGQAKGYTLFCDKMYFASLNEFKGKDVKFNEEDIEIAKYLGIGLIQIKRENSGFVCNEVLKAATSMPIKRLREHALKSKVIFTCQSCKVIQRYEKNYTRVPRNLDEIHTYANATYVKNQIKGGKGLLTKNGDFYCNTCARMKLKIG